MKKTLFFLLTLLCCGATAFSQDLPIPNTQFMLTESIPCPFNPGETVVWPTGWSVYQTQNDHWDGPVDSTRCISVASQAQNFTNIPLDQIDPEKALFIRLSLPGKEGILLNADDVYSIGAGINLAAGDTISRGESCPNHLCSGLITVVEIPDESGTGTDRRIATTSLPDSVLWSFAWSCLVTEYFPENILREVIIKVSFDHITSGEAMQMTGIGVETSFQGVNRIEEMVFPESSFTGEDYQAYIHNVARPPVTEVYAPYIFLHERNVYPNQANVTYVEARPENTTTEPQELRVTVDPDQNLLFQPYTAIRGALVDPSDTVRHRLTLINDGGTICIPSIVELVVTDDTEVEFRSGQVDFHAESSCMMFRHGGVLVIPDQTHYEYGNSGIGALGLDKGGTIRIGKGSELVINNTVILANFINDADRQVYMELNPGSRLTFGEKARLIRKGYVQTGQMKLNVYMNGGILDDSRLSDKERQLINRIYPDKEMKMTDRVKILGNPIRNVLHLAVYTPENNGQAAWTVHDLQGRYLGSGNFATVQGQQLQDIPLQQLAAGMYILKMELDGGMVSRKFVKVE
ncbi:MAG: T9SS type A sorting domain-containing protein [Saprospiraceae bacterium]|nr:T9SS type A sorting domain-containing protein [Lewinella sp.]